MLNLRLFFLSFLVLSCSHKEVKAPGHIINKDKLVDVQVDLYLVEAVNNMNILSQDSADIKYKMLFETVMKKHNITKEDYESSLRYYTLDNKSMNEIYDSVMFKLTTLENKEVYGLGKDSL